MQFLILGYDGKDADAPMRRQAARAAHLECVKRMRETGNFIEGGAILDEGQQMIGSAMIVEFPDEGDMQQWLKNDPYVTGNVWQQIEFKPFRCAPR